MWDFFSSWWQPKLKFIRETTDSVINPDDHPDVAGSTYTETYTALKSNVSICRKVEIAECPSGRGAYVNKEAIQFKVSDKWESCWEVSRFFGKEPVFDVIKRICDNRAAVLNWDRDYQQARDKLRELSGREYYTAISRLDERRPHPVEIDEIISDLGHETTQKPR